MRYTTTLNKKKFCDEKQDVATLQKGASLTIHFFFS